VAYQLNLYHGKALTSSQLLEAPLEEAKEMAIAAISSRRAERVELVSRAGTVVFQRWAVL
jgi:hypothetical protein